MIRRLMPLLLLTAVPLAAQQREVRAQRAAPDVAIRLWVPAGMVEVEGWDHDSVEVRATPAKGTRFGGGGTAVAMKFSLENLRTNDTLLPSAQMRVFVPRGAKVWVKSTVAGVNVVGMTGQLDVLQVGGSTVVANGGGIVTVESIAGTVEVRRVDGTVRLRGGAGNVALDEITGTVDASLVSGQVMVTSGTGLRGLSRGRIETVSGRIWFIGGLAPNGHLELTTHDGPIALTVRGPGIPRVEISGSPSATTVEPVLLGGSPQAGTFLLRTFKGAINGSLASGI